jgi:hypothetical protein
VPRERCPNGVERSAGGASPGGSAGYFDRVVTDWGKYLKDVTMATTILDRLMHRRSMLEGSSQETGKIVR